jgi:hypothetical protein
MPDYLDGAIDLHVHIGPDDSPRYYDSIDLAREASARHMKAIVIKDHLASTASKAVLSTKVSPSAVIFGALALNETVGGLNPRSVVSAIRTGAKVIWMPTVDAFHCIKKAKEGHWIKEYVDKKEFGYPVKGIPLLTQNPERLRSEAVEILEICKRHDVILSTGHVGPEECLALARKAADLNFSKLIVCHPNAWLEDFPPSLLKSLTDLGATLELTFGACSPLHGRLDPHAISAIIRHVGPERCVLSTDYGQVECASPPEGLRIFCVLMSKCGISDEEIVMMTRENPARLLNLRV